MRWRNDGVAMTLTAMATTKDTPPSHAGPEPAATMVQELATSMGFDAVVIGGYEAVALLESHAQLWIHLAFRTGFGRAFGFVVADRSGPA